MPSLRVAILAQYPVHLLPGFSGAASPGHYATWLPQLSREFAAQAGDVEIHWIATNPLCREATVVRENGQTFHLLPQPAAKRALTLYCEERAQIGRVLDEIRPRIVHAWGTEDVYGLAGVTSGRPCLLSMQGILSQYALHARLHPREYFHALLELYCLNRATHISTESEWGRQMVLHRAPRAKVSLVEYGVRHHFLDLQWQPQAARPVALFVGTVVPRKGVQDAVLAMNSLRGQPGELWIAGDDTSAWAQKLKSSSPPNVKWLGKRSSAETGDLLTQAWCLVLPTRGDTSPNVVKEARVIGLPVITTPCGGQTQYVRHGENGFLVPPRQIPQLALRLAAIFTDFEKTRILGGTHLAENREALSPTKTAAGFLALYRSLAS